eukprot:gene10621-2743_t
MATRAVSTNCNGYSHFGHNFFFFLCVFFLINVIELVSHVHKCEASTALKPKGSQSAIRMPMFGTPKANAPLALFVFCPHKTGSVLMGQLLDTIATLTEQCHFRVEHVRSCTPSNQAPGFVRGMDVDRKCHDWIINQVQRAANPLQATAVQKLLFSGGFIWGPIRHSMPHSSISEIIVNLRHVGFSPYIIMHRRHPLDQLVSEYHSFGFQHPPPVRASPKTLEEFYFRRERIQNLTVDEYVLMQLASHDWWSIRYGTLLHILNQKASNLQILHSKYEDMVFKFQSWLASLLNVFKTWPEETRKKIGQGIWQQFAPSFKPDGRHKHTLWPGPVEDKKIKSHTTGGQVRSFNRFFRLEHNLRKL